MNKRKPLIPTMCNPIYWARVHWEMSKDTFGIPISYAILSSIILVLSFAVYYFSWTTIFVTIGIVTSGSVVACVYWGMNYLALFKLPKHKQNQMIDKAVAKSERELAVRILDLDGTLHSQQKWIQKYKPEICDARKLGPYIRMGCGYENFKLLSTTLDSIFHSPFDGDHPLSSHPRHTTITFFGSNDFHHISLQLLRRYSQPFNLVIFDNHPDFFAFPLGSHCGSWYHQASSLPTVQQSFHFGGFSGEFEDEFMEELCPWDLLHSSKLAVFPATRKFEGLKWSNVVQKTLRKNFGKSSNNLVYQNNFGISRNRVEKILLRFKDVLERFPVYITLDKDVMKREEAVQNWNSGVLSLEEVMVIIEVLMDWSEKGGGLLGMDITGDWSEVEVKGLARILLHKWQHSHSETNVDQKQARKVNESTNLKILDMIQRKINNKNS